MEENYKFLSFALIRKLDILEKQINTIEGLIFDNLNGRKLMLYCQSEFLQLQKFIQDIIDCLESCREYLQKDTKLSLVEFDSLITYLKDYYRPKYYKDLLIK